MFWFNAVTMLDIPKNSKVAIVGSRNFDDYNLVNERLKNYVGNISEIISGDVENIKIFNSKKINIHRKKNIYTKEINMMLTDVKDVYVNYDFIYKNDVLNLYFDDGDKNKESIMKSLKENIDEGEVVIKNINDDDIFK